MKENKYLSLEEFECGFPEEFLHECELEYEKAQLMGVIANLRIENKRLINTIRLENEKNHELKDKIKLLLMRYDSPRKNKIGHATDVDPQHILYVTETRELAEEWSKKRIEPLFESDLVNCCEKSHDLTKRRLTLTFESSPCDGCGSFDGMPGPTQDCVDCKVEYNYPSNYSKPER